MSASAGGQRAAKRGGIGLQIDLASRKLESSEISASTHAVAGVVQMAWTSPPTPPLMA